MGGVLILRLAAGRQAGLPHGSPDNSQKRDGSQNREHTGGTHAARPNTPTRGMPVHEDAGPESLPSMDRPLSGAMKSLQKKILREETQMISPYGIQQTPPEGVTVIGEAVRRVAAESAEFLIEITTAASAAAQALRDVHAKTAHVAEALGALGVQQTDLQTISLTVCNSYSPVAQASPGYAGLGFAGLGYAGPGYAGQAGSFPQIGPGAFSGYGAGAAFSGYGGGAISGYGGSAAMQPDVQFGAYHARNMLRLTVREPARVGEVVDTAARAGAAIVGAFSFRVTDEAGARRAALEAAGRDARAKADALAAAAGKKVGEPVGIAEDLVATNGNYAAIRSMLPLAFGAGAPLAIGELEYYARVSASFRFQ